MSKRIFISPFRGLVLIRRLQSGLKYTLLIAGDRIFLNLSLETTV
jgi:hypothetical protein